jgi:NhaP-type Na+/H+ or K+/H+ antiporter
MEISKAFQSMDSYDLWLVIIGLAILAIALLPRLLAKAPLSGPIVLLALGYAAVALPLGLEALDPLKQGELVEHLTELGVIIALMGAGLKIDRPPGLRAWSSTWRLLGITMILTIILATVVGWWIAGLVPVTAMLFGAIISPTDPVLASDVQVGPPGEEAPGEMRFSLTSEAGLNDGLAFPFTNMAIAMAIAGTHPAGWIEAWLVVDVLAKIGIAIITGYALGHFLARILLTMPATTALAKGMIGLGGLAATLIIFGATEYAGGYGFIATFVGAVIIRNHDRGHEYHDALHMFIEKAEHLLMAGILIALGGAVAGGLLVPLTWPMIVAAVLIVFLVRPVSGVLGLIGFDRAPWRERLAISFFGIRGIGSLYYLSYALNEEEFPEAKELWALVGLVLVISIVVHGVTATPITDKLDELRVQENQGP